MSPTPVRRELFGHKGFIRSLVFSPDGRTLISADGDKFIKLWDLTVRTEPPMLLGHREGITSLVVSPDGRTAASSSGDRTLRLWNLATRREVARFELPSAASYTSTVFAPDGGAIFLSPPAKDPSPTLVWRAPSLAEADATPAAAK